MRIQTAAIAVALCLVTLNLLAPAAADLPRRGADSLAKFCREKPAHISGIAQMSNAVYKPLIALPFSAACSRVSTSIGRLLMGILRTLTVHPFAIADLASNSARWYASARITGEENGNSFSALFDFSPAFATQAEAEAYALSEGNKRARQLQGGDTE